MLEDLGTVPHSNRLAQVYNADSRKGTIILVTIVAIYVLLRPPYLNNLDYGEVSKVSYIHFLK